MQTLSNRHIDAIINQGVDDAWHFMGFYGEPDTTSWENSWVTLCALSHRSSLPLMKFCFLRRKWGGWTDRRAKCRVLVMLWIIVD